MGVGGPYASSPVSLRNPIVTAALETPSPRASSALDPYTPSSSSLCHRAHRSGPDSRRLPDRFFGR